MTQISKFEFKTIVIITVPTTRILFGIFWGQQTQQMKIYAYTMKSIARELIPFVVR